MKEHEAAGRKHAFPLQPHVESNEYHSYHSFPLTMSRPPTKRRRTNAIGPDSAVFARASTHKTITTTNRSGIVITKDVLVPLVKIKTPLTNPTASSSNPIPSDNSIHIDDYNENVNHDNLNHQDDFRLHNKPKVSISKTLCFLYITKIFIRRKKITFGSLLIEYLNY